MSHEKDEVVHVEIGSDEPMPSVPGMVAIAAEMRDGRTRYAFVTKEKAEKLFAERAPTKTSFNGAILLFCEQLNPTREPLHIKSPAG